MNDLLVELVTCAPMEDFSVKVVAQDELESDITKRATRAIAAKERELEEKRLKKASADLQKVVSKLKTLQAHLADPHTKISQRKLLKLKIESIEQHELIPLQLDLRDIQNRMKTTTHDEVQHSADRMEGESERDFLIRTGKITAFGNTSNFGTVTESTSQSLRKPGFDETEDTRNVDDGIEESYQKRLKAWIDGRSALRKAANDKDEWLMEHPTIPDAVLNEEFRLPGDVHPSLFDYQKTCVQWLWELYSQKTGGIIGDEMGLGKTVQVIAFLAGLHHSGLLNKPVLLVVPATVMNQWVNEFHRWWPPLRCVILHSIGLGMQGVVSEEQLDLEIEDEAGSGLLKSASKQANAREIVERVFEKGHVLVTTYVGLRIYSNLILPKKWGYVVLDEGHKIRNPNLDILLTCKRLKTYNRIILSGTPIQNNLVELWLLFDFVFPGRLGTLPVFEQQFAVPIKMGGYANASNVQVQSGYKCAVVLRDLISPYLLRRLKVDVARDLPKKSEMVLFVRLTKVQQELYERFLGGEDVNAILKGRRNVLMGVDMLRKICNHPDLVDREALLRKRGYQYGNPATSGKMQVLKSLLELWQDQGHRTLLFCQTKQMLDILESFVSQLHTVSKRLFVHLRMDGDTAIGRRQELVDAFNNGEQDVFLLTTKVGGLGVNLTGADRVIIYDPDWNPSTDIQARERAWRLGQKKDITIYRLMTAGTIEEKIYHRQIFKTFLTNKILKDPKQRRFFKNNDLHDLFSLGDPDQSNEDMFKAPGQPTGANDDDLLRVAGLQGVLKMGKFEDPTEEKEEEKTDDAKDDDRLIKGLFGVRSTLAHEDVFAEQEVSLVEQEADRVAKAAAEALKKSRVAARRNAVGTPTWTGKFGKKGLGKGGVSSASILGGLRQKEQAAKETGAKEKIAQRLVEFLAAQENRTSKSSAILAQLTDMDMTQEKEVVLVRSILRQVATWRKDERLWRLKPEFAS